MLQKKLKSTSLPPKTDTQQQELLHHPSAALVEFANYADLKAESAIQPPAALLPPEPAKLSFASFEELQAKYHELEGNIHEELGKWAEETVVSGWRRLLPYFSMMHDVLSQRGRFHNKDNDLSGWVEWYDGLQIEVNQAFTGAIAKLNMPLPADLPKLPADLPELPSLRMVQFELKQLTDGTAEPTKPQGVHKGGRPKGKGKGKDGGKKTITINVGGKTHHPPVELAEALRATAGSDPRTETQDQIVAGAGVKLAALVVDEKIKPEKIHKAAGELIDAVEGGDYSLLPQSDIDPVRTPEEEAAIQWCLRILSTYISNNSKKPQATEARKHATIMRRILEEEFLGDPPDPDVPTAQPDPVTADLQTESEMDKMLETAEAARDWHEGGVNYWTNVAKQRKAAEEKAKEEQEAWLQKKKAEAMPKPEPPAPAQAESTSCKSADSQYASEGAVATAVEEVEMDEEDSL